MKIVDKVIDKRDDIVAGPNGASVADENQRLAILAVLGGLNSTAWRRFMEQFVNNDNPNQLRRLMGTDASMGDTAMDKRRAYIVGNAICGWPTGPTTGREVATIDEGLQPDEPTDTQDGAPTPPRVI